MKERKAEETIKRLVSMTSDLRSEEMERARSRMKAGADPEEVLDDMSRALVSKLFAKPFGKLKEASRKGRMDYCDLASDLFGVDGE